MIKKFVSIIFFLSLAFVCALLSLKGLSATSTLALAEDVQKPGCMKTTDNNDSPQLTFTVPSVINLSNQSAVVIKGTGLPNLPVIYQVIAGVTGTSGRTQADASGNFSITLDLSTLSDGDIFFTLIQKIDECNEVMASQKSVKETVPPTLVNFVVNCVTNSENQVIFSIVGTTEGGSTVQYKVSDGIHNLSGSANVDAQQNFVINNLNVSSFNSPIDVSVTVTDEAGNVSDATHKQVNSCLVEGFGGGGGGETKVTKKASTTQVILPEAGSKVDWKLTLYYIFTLATYLSIRKIQISKYI